ncbi:CBS domain-containing protein [Halorientalis marina]|jgi:CBS domain-containing protein|uniref:CBS domain-containing protein n=1 Tax=Halorientalis marina TaxID=2931976 RepID=UPI001FF29BE3|nr:CBS domain-containing protein [Halorientalis marina]
MNGDVTVREVMRREYVAASEGDSLHETAALMLEESVDAVVVLRGQEPVGMLTERDVLERAVETGSLDGLTVADAMATDLPTVTPDESLSGATELISGADTRRLLVTEEGQPVGIVSEHDVVTASTLSPDMNGARSVETDEAMMTDAVAPTAESATADTEYSNQGICEVCGSLTRDLSTFNGQLVCNDCKDV